MTTSTITSASLTRMRAGAFALCGLAAVLAAGCTQKTACKPLDDCGGPKPVGTWVLAANHPSCSDDLYTPPPDPRLTNADIPAARLPVPEPALFDWCQLLVTGPNLDDIVSKQPPYLIAESAPVGVTTLHYEESGHYALSTTRTGTFVIDFPSFCIRAFGGTDKTTDVCQQLQASFKAKQAKRYRNFRCESNGDAPAGQAGCFCAFDLVDIQESVGIFASTSRATIRHLSGNAFPESVDYCVQGDRLQLTAADGEYLFDRVGLRTLDLVKLNDVNCTDHMQGPGEDGVDCGPACSIMCGAIKCNDQVQGPGEDGVDCGPNCPKPCAAPI